MQKRNSPFIGAGPDICSIQHQLPLGFCPYLFGIELFGLQLSAWWYYLESPRFTKNQNSSFKPPLSSVHPPPQKLNVRPAPQQDMGRVVGTGMSHSFHKATPT